MWKIKTFLIGVVLILLFIGCQFESVQWCVSCGERFEYGKLRVNEYGVQFCVPCTKLYPNFFKNILNAEDKNGSSGKNPE